MTYQAFTTAVNEAGLIPCLTGKDGHWRIRGGSRQIVDVWSHTKHGFRFQATGGKGSRSGTLDEAIALAGPRKKEVSPEVCKAADPWEYPAEHEPTIQLPQVGLIRRFWRWLW